VVALNQVHYLLARAGAEKAGSNNLPDQLVLGESCGVLLHCLYTFCQLTPVASFLPLRRASSTLITKRLKVAIGVKEPRKFCKRANNTPATPSLPA
jgi:hypothetical protein